MPARGSCPSRALYVPAFPKEHIQHMYDEEYICMMPRGRTKKLATFDIPAY